jgi:hypothetical protein
MILQRGTAHMKETDGYLSTHIACKKDGFVRSIKPEKWRNYVPITSNLNGFTGSQYPSNDIAMTQYKPRGQAERQNRSKQDCFGFQAHACAFGIDRRAIRRL